MAKELQAEGRGWVDVVPRASQQAKASSWRSR